MSDTRAAETEATTTKPNGAAKTAAKNRGRVISHPGDVAGLVMMQVDNVNAKKDELTIAIKGLTDTAKQLVRAYAEHAKAIAQLQKKVSELESKK